MRNDGVSAGQGHAATSDGTCAGVPVGAFVCTRTHGEGSLSTRLDVVRAAEHAAGIVATVCGHKGCGIRATGKIHGIPMCVGHEMVTRQKEMSA